MVEASHLAVNHSACVRYSANLYLDHKKCSTEFVTTLSNMYYLDYLFLH